MPHCLIGGTLCPAVTASEQLRLVGVLPVTQISYSNTEADVWDSALATQFAFCAFTVSGRATTTRINRELHVLSCWVSFPGLQLWCGKPSMPYGKAGEPPAPLPPPPPRLVECTLLYGRLSSIIIHLLAINLQEKMNDNLRLALASSFFLVCSALVTRVLQHSSGRRYSTLIYIYILS